MTGPFPGEGDIPQPWDGRPPPESPYAAGYPSGDGTQDVDQEWKRPPWDDEPASGGPPPRGPNRLVTAALVVALVVVLGGGVALWWFAAGPGRSDAPRPVAATSSNPPPVGPVPARSSTSASPNDAAAYDVGSCFAEVAGLSPGKVELNPVPCAGSEAVFVINRVVDTATDCDVGADFKNHGYEVPDETANVAYCASLVAPVDVCFTLAAAQPIERTACDSAPGTVKVLSIEPAPSAAVACTDKPNPDVWFYQSPTSGEFACVSRPPNTGGSTAPRTPTAPLTPTTGSTPTT